MKRGIASGSALRRFEYESRILARLKHPGVAQVMAIAKAIKALPEPPRRSILINLVGAEEQGLLGSEYYALNPTVAPGMALGMVWLFTGSE